MNFQDAYNNDVILQTGLTRDVGSTNEKFRLNIEITNGSISLDVTLTKSWALKLVKEINLILEDL